MADDAAGRQTQVVPGARRAPPQGNADVLPGAQIATHQVGDVAPAAGAEQAEQVRRFAFHVVPRVTDVVPFLPVHAAILPQPLDPGRQTFSNGYMSDVQRELAAFSSYLEQAAQIAPQSVATAVSVVLLSCACQCAEIERLPAEERSWESLLQDLYARARQECRIAPSTAPLVERLLHHFQAFGEHHLRNDVVAG